MSGRPMSISATSGRSARSASIAAAPSSTDGDLVALMRSSSATSSRRSGGVVADDRAQRASRGAWSRCAAAGTSRASPRRRASSRPSPTSGSTTAAPVPRAHARSVRRADHPLAIRSRPWRSMGPMAQQSLCLPCHSRSPALQRPTVRRCHVRALTARCDTVNSYDAAMPRLSSAEVFTPTSYPTHTYVRATSSHHERLLARMDAASRRRSRRCPGPSKAGKTVLVQRVVGEGNLITVSGASVRTPDQLWERVLDWWGEPHATTASTRRRPTTDTHDARARRERRHRRAPAVARAAATRAPARTRETDAGDREPARPAAGRAGAREHAVHVLLDDFHYIPAAIQSDVAQQLKDAASRGVRICVASVPHRADNVVRALPELRGRVLAIDLDYWSRARICSRSRGSAAAARHRGRSTLARDVRERGRGLAAADAVDLPVDVQPPRRARDRASRRERSRSTSSRARRSCS